MRVSNLRLVRGPALARAVATVAWEDRDRPPLELFFQTDARGADDLAPEPEAFLTACILPAMRDGERRVLLEGAVCARLAAGVATAVTRLRSWYGAPRGPVAIEASRGFREIAPRRPERAAFFFTGGIDSLHLLQRNRLAYPLGHSDSFADALASFGHLCPTNETSLRWNDAILRTLSAASEESRLGVIPIRSNVWELAPDVEFLAAESLAASLACAAHLFRRRWSTITFASGRDAGRQPLRGTHPLLDPLYSSGALEVRHDVNSQTRFERLQAIAASPRLLENLLVCLAFPGPPYLNCGECEKCVRTMTALVALGKLEQARQFPVAEVTPGRIRAISIGKHDADYWKDLLPLLAAQGRADMVRAIEEKLEETRRLVLWSSDAGWRGGLRRIDRRYLGGRLLKIRRRLSASART